MLEKDFRLVTLGRLTLCPPSGRAVEGLDELNARRRKVALLAVLALRRRPVSRDTLLEMFWGGQDEARARHSLSDAVSHLRRVLGRDAIVATRSELSLATDVPLVVDALEFAASAAEPDERSRAIAMYGGQFLEGVYVAGSTSFETWAAREQVRFQRMFVTACELECATLIARDAVVECATLAERWLEVEPLSARAALTLMDSVSRSGTPEDDARALAAYDRLRLRLAREYDVAPDDAVVRRAREITETMRARRPADVSIPDPEPRTAVANAPADVVMTVAVDPPAPPLARWRPGAWLAYGAAVTIVGLSAALGARRPGGATVPPSRPVIAVAEMLAAGPDTTTRWLTDALPQMIASKLVRSSDVDVVSPAALRAVRARSQSVGGSLSIDAMRDRGRRSGAKVFVSGAFMQRGKVIVLDLRLLDVRSGRSTQLEMVTDSSVLTAVDRAAVRVLAAVGANPDGPEFAEIETASLEAYQHFVRSHQVAYSSLVESVAELDAAIALDSGFTSAVLNRAIYAIAEDDRSVISRLSTVLEKRIPRIAERDRLEWESRIAFMNGDIERSESLARMLVQRYPRDPRGYQVLAMVYDGVGRWDAQERVLGQLLALDSLGMEAGRGPCLSCYVLGSLTNVRLFRADWSGAERVAKRWTALTPDIHSAWTNLAFAQAYHGNFTDALTSARRARAIAPNEPYVLLTSAWMHLMSRNFDAVESEIATWGSSESRAIRRQALDVRATLQRERGQYRAANETAQRAIAEFPELYWLGLQRADGLARLGKCDEAVATMEGIHEQKRMREEPAAGGSSRAFAWHHALVADFIARGGNCVAPATPTLESLADSVDRIGRRSYYGRDWTLHHHVRGLVAEQKGDLALAEEELRKAQWRVGDGWTRSMAELGLVQLARGRTAEALASFRNAYATRPDAMGRYQPRSELDLYMALAFRRAGELDSARLYQDYVRRAWHNADPEVRQLLRRLDAAP
jgi:DNA-binding SARP family transcriptional activator/tetratricopeptide (TPR) repeat protein/TolB-like protein